MRVHLLRGSIAAVVFTSTTLVVTPAGPARADVNPDAVQQLTLAAASLSGSSLLPELAPAVPGLYTSPAQLLGLHEVFGDLASLNPAGDIETQIDALDGDGVTFDNVSAGGTPLEVSFDLAIDKTVAVPLAIVEGDAQVVGGEIDVQVTMPATTISFEYDASVGAPAEAFALTDLPTLAFTIGVAVDDVSVPLQFGFADALATGSFHLTTDISVELLDPDGNGRLTASEASTSAIADLVALGFPAGASPDLDVDLTLTATVAGASFGGTLTLTDTALFADPAPEIDLSAAGANPIDVLANLGPDLAATSLAQLLSAFGGGMIAGDVRLPFLADGVFLPSDLQSGFDQVFAPVQPLYDYVTPRAAGQIVCGPNLSTPPDAAEDGIPAGPIKGLHTGDVVHCRTYTSVDGGAVNWTVESGNATVTTNGTSADTIGADPTRNATFTMTADGDLDVSVVYTPTGAASPVEVLPRPETIQELIVELIDADIIPDGGVVWNPTLQAFEFTVSTGVADPAARSASLNAGDELVASTGITGLQGAASASASVDLGAVNAGVTFGLIAADDEATINPADNGTVPPGPSDRFYLRADGALLSVDDVEVAGNLDMVGRLGFLQVDVDATGSLGKPDGTLPALALNITNPTGVTVGAGSDPGALLVRDLVTDPTAHIGADVNLQFDGTATVTASAAVVAATGIATISWDLADAVPTVSLDGNFDSQLSPFDQQQTFTYTGAGTDGTLFETTGVDFLSMAGLVGSSLVDASGTTCTVAAVITATSLRCTDDTGTNPITFVNGTTYDLKGNTLSHLVEILDAIEQFATYLETTLGEDAFGQPLDLVGIRPADVVTQVGNLRQMVDEFRGIQDAQINCTATDGTDPLDVRALPIADGASQDITCHAITAAADATNVEWRIGDGAWTPAPAGTVGSDAAVTVTLGVSGDLDTDVPEDDHVHLGSEYDVAVRWTSGAGDQRAQLPPPTPQSLQQLDAAITDLLGLPDSALEFVLDTTAATPTLRINLGYGICSSTAPSESADDCTDLPTGPTPSASLNFDLGPSIPDFVGLETIGTIDVQYAALGQFDIGVPLDGSEPVLYGTTGLEARLEVNGSESLSISANIGPAGFAVGAAATGPTGAADAGSDADTLIDTVDFVGAGIHTGATVTNTTTGAECFVTVVTTNELTCAPAGEWHEGDEYRIGGVSDLHAALAVALDLGDAANAPVADGDSVLISDATPILPDLDTFLAGDAECGNIDAANSDEVVADGVAGDDSTPLGGIACGRFSLALTAGTATAYLGEVGLDLDGDGLTVWVPNDLATRIADAALNPAFLLHALPEILAEIEQGLNDAADGGVPAALADPLRAGADGVGGIRQAVETGLQAFEDSVGAFTGTASQLEAFLDDQLTTLITDAAPDLDVTVEVNTTCGNADCADDAALLDIDGVEATVTIGQSVVAEGAINLGLDGLPLSVSAGAEAGAEWNVTLGIGVSRDNGPYVKLVDGDEIGLHAFVNLAAPPGGCPTFDQSPLAANQDQADWSSERCVKARLAFLSLVARDSESNPSAIDANVGLDITGTGSDPVRLTLGDILAGRFDASFGADGSVNLNLHFRTGFEEQSAEMPSLLGTIHFEVAVSAENGIGDPTFEFGNLYLDLGTFIQKFIDPIAKEIRNITGPLQPIIDVITAPIPVVSDLAVLAGGEPVTMITILEAATGADLSLVKAVAAFITFVNNLPSDVATQIPLGPLVNGLDAAEREPGAFKVNTAAASGTVSPQDAGTLINQTEGYVGGSGFVSDIAGETGLPAGNEAQGRPSTFGVPGLSFPFLEDASQLFGVLVGRDAVLVRWDAGTMRASAGLSYDFGPIMVGPVPITISIGGEIGIEGRFAIGYDTSGIRKVLSGGSGVHLFDGIFIDDLDTNGVDVPEIRFFGRVFAGAKVDLVIISAGVRGGIELTFDLNLNDSPDPDGKLRIEEIISKLQNPICLFDVSGKIEAFLEAFVEIDLFFYSEEFSFELVRITLLEWSSSCEPPEPVLSEGTGVLYLNVGSRSDLRNIAEGDPDKLEVRQLGPGHVRVSGYGWEEERTGVTLIVADLGEDDDELKFLPGQDPEYVDTTPDEVTEEDQAHQFPFTIPTAVTGGSGHDVIKTGDGPDYTNGDNALSIGSWAGVAFTPPSSQGGDAGDDTINSGAGNDVANGDGAKDSIEGEAGADTIRGGGEDDRLNGGPGDDAVLGGDGLDTIQGGPVDQPGPGETPDDDDALVGGAQRDTVTGDFGNDVIFGDDAAGGFFTDTGGVLTWATPSQGTWLGWCPGGSGDLDLLTGNEGDDWIVGGGGDDQIDAGAGNDHACGSAGNDNVLGGDGDDEVRGDENDDAVNGDAGHDVAHGGTENDNVHGGTNDDDVFGGAGSDLVSGDDGDDIVIGDEATIAAGHPHGVDTGAGALDPAAVVTMSGAVTRAAGGSGARRADCSVVLGDSDCLFGGNGSDSMFGTGDGDIGFGDAGADYIEGNGGNDDLRGGIQDDLLFGNEGDDAINGDSGADQAYGDRSVPDWQIDDPNGTGVDTINGGPDADHLEGDGSGDTIVGAGANDHIEGNDGDDTLHGEAGDDDVIGGSDRATEPDGGETLMTGGTGKDVLVGDNGSVVPGGIAGGRTVTLLDPTIGGADTIEGDADQDYAFGGPGGDTIWGDHGVAAPVLGSPAADYIEGDDGDDTISGEAGDDDLVGGGSAADGVIDADRTGSGLTDAGETLISGGDGLDWIAGDNARMNRVLLAAPDYPNDAAPGFDPIALFDVARTGGPVIDAGTSGGDLIHGDAERDLIFGQGANDTVHGDAGTDYIEGNAGVDTMSGGDADDDLVGGGSAADGIIDRVRVGTTLHDGGELSMSGGDGVDWMAGDNALANRILFADPVTPVTLFDVNSVDPLVSGGDTMSGDGANDVMFGQGNGAQGDQSDPADGLDNDADGTVDEDGAGWLGDIVHGGDGNDYAEGNHGSDLVLGEGGDDDLIGGGSAIDGVIDADRVGNDLLDARDTVHGGDGADVIGGDNARILPAASGVLWLTGARAVVLFDVNSANTTLSGGDSITGGEGDDVAFGQGNGTQPATAADPLNGVDDDLDGRESAASTEYDCADGTDNDGTGGADATDPECLAAIDEDQPWFGDVIAGNGGIDYVEGNHGADWIDGGDGADMLTGGGSAIDGVIDADRTGVGLLDGHDLVIGGGGQDVEAGDNAVITPVKAGAAWAPIPNANATFDLLARTVTMAQTPEAAGRFGNDHIIGDAGHDQQYGQQGNDWIEGNADDDSVVGDLGLIVPTVETGSRAAHIEPRQPFLEDDIFTAGTLTYTTTLYSQVTANGAAGNDIILGGQGHDDLHGGPGNDIMNGDRYAPPDPPDPDLIDMIPGQFVWDDPAIGQSPLADEDAVFGGYGDDVMWGGRGPDHLYGGFGRDFLDVRPRPNATPDFPVDPPGWFTWVALPGTQEHYQDSDVIYGGYDADALQANLADTGPNNGDRLLDWSGAYNIYYVCPPVYGDWVITRSIAPGILEFINDLAAGDGLPQVTTAGSSGFVELGLVYTKDVKNNTNPHHPETPGHFYCGDG